MKIWAISDLHLGFSTGKWMDVFGDDWKNHPDKIAAAWRDLVLEKDIVLVPGDFSWAMRTDDVAVELDWLAALPGRKVLIKGNHDFWWPSSRKKLRDILPEGVYAIKKTSLVLDGLPIIGVRACDFVPRDPEAVEQTESNLHRERREFERSIESLAEHGPLERGPIALFHYPPFPLWASESVFTRMAEEAACTHGLFGHLHTEPEWKRVFQGKKNGVQYHLVSCDALDFCPILIDEM
jgi:hypothetical protein